MPNPFESYKRNVNAFNAIKHSQRPITSKHVTIETLASSIVISSFEQSKRNYLKKNEGDTIAISI